MREDRRGGRKVRPTLPFKLTKELGGDGDSIGSRGGGRGGGRGGSFKRKDRRKEEREAKKHKPRPQYIPKEDRNASKSLTERHSNKRSLPNSNEAPNAAFNTGGKNKKIRQDDRQPKSNLATNGQKLPTPQKVGNSRFGELLPPAEDPEKVLQRQLARKLGIKKKAKAGKKIKFGDEGDGMDELMAELGGMDDILDSASDAEAEQEEEEQESDYSGSREEFDFDVDDDDQELDDRSYLQMKKRKATMAAAVAAAAVKDDRKKTLIKKYSVTALSDSEEELELEDEDESDSDESDDHLGGISELNHEHDDLGFEDSDYLIESDDGTEQEEEGSSGSDSEEEVDSDDDDDDDDNDNEMLLYSSDDDDQEGAKGEVEEGKPSASAGKYVPPAVRRAQAAAAAAGNGAGSTPRSRDEELVIRRVRGLLNRMAEANLQGIVGYVDFFILFFQTCIFTFVIFCPILSPLLLYYNRLTYSSLFFLLFILQRIG